MSKLYRTEFIVKGRGRFPMDMLRYDVAYPRNTEDCSNITDSYQETLNVGTYDALFEITLIHIEHGDKNWKPTIARWRSFGWVVSKTDTREF